MSSEVDIEKEVEQNSNENRKPIQMGMHSVSNLLGTHKQLSLFSDKADQISLENNVVLDSEIQQYGIDLKDVESRVMEGILRGFTETSYEGNIPPQSLEELANEKYAGKLPDTYKYIDKIPRIRITQTQLLKLAGVKNTSIGEVQRALEALKTLGTRQYCFYYDRLAFDSAGKPLKDNKGNWQKEEVSAVDTLFLIKEVRDKKSKVLKYYEIIPSSIFLDQRENYFLLIPHNFREEVTNLVGNKKASSYTFRFLLFLRYQYERRRRNKNLEPPYQVKMHWEEVAVALKMPESVYKKNKKRANKLLDEVYSVALELGYLISYDRSSGVDILVLKDEKYYKPGDFSFNTSSSAKAIAALSDVSISVSKEAEDLLKRFYQERKKLDAAEKVPEGELKKAYVQELMQLLKERTAEDIIKLVQWALNQEYYCSRISNPKKLTQNFSDTWVAMQASRKKHAETRVIDNKAIAKNFAQKVEKAKGKFVAELSKQYIEVRDPKTNAIEYVNYDSRAFKEELELVAAKFKLQEFI